MKKDKLPQKQFHRVCHCGKCTLKCNKHGQKAKCSDCGKMRMLGTVIEKGEIRYACGECCDRLSKENERKFDSQMNELITTLKKENQILDEDGETGSVWHGKEDEILE